MTYPYRVNTEHRHFCDNPGDEQCKRSCHTSWEITQVDAHNYNWLTEQHEPAGKTTRAVATDNRAVVIEQHHLQFVAGRVIAVNGQRVVG